MEPSEQAYEDCKQEIIRVLLQYKLHDVDATAQVFSVCRHTAQAFPDSDRRVTEMLLDDIALDLS